MHKAPSVRQPREIFDRHGQLLGRSTGFRPDPGSGGLGLEVELTPETRASLNTPLRTVWVPETEVIAVRRDRLLVDLTVEELRRFVREPASPELARDELGGRLEA